MLIEYDIVIVGAGPAGLAAAIEAKKNGISSILLVDRELELGGILQQCIHNGFGLQLFNKELTGPEYAEVFIRELTELKIEYKLDTMVIDITNDKILTMVNSKDGLLEVKAKAIVLAMGCRERTRGALNIPGTRPSGIFTAGTAQRLVNIEGCMVGKKVVILGSGDIGLIMARRMTLEGAEVLAVLELMPYSSGLTRNIVQCLEDFDIPLYLRHTISRIHGRHRLEGVSVTEVDINGNPVTGTDFYISCDTLLLSVGLIPENELTKAANIEIDKSTNGPLVTESMETSVQGIFACGNVVHVHDLADHVTLEARIAGLNAAKYVSGLKNKEGRCLSVSAGIGIRYVVPQYINLQNIEGSVDLYFRADNVYKDAVLLVSLDDTVVSRQKKKRIVPGEVEHIRLNSLNLNSTSAVNINIELLSGSMRGVSNEN